MKFFIFKKNIILFLILLFFTILQIKIGLFWGYSINFVLYFLIVSCFFVSYLELLFLNLIAILLINWKPSLNLEI
ncbi:MAG: hypothetical protein NZ484_01850, partial [Patescibacteria group bacterium]|nr:hypothetical protein [Patescibacteria group bacterium]